MSYFLDRLQFFKRNPEEFADGRIAVCNLARSGW